MGDLEVQLTIDRFSELNRIKENLGTTVSGIHNELNEHLDSINQNSIEIQSSYDYMEEIVQKLDKLHSRIDELESSMTQPQNYDNKSELNDKEKEVFLVLYTSNEPLSYEEIATRASLPIYLMEEIINSLDQKRIPVIRRNFAGKLLFILDEKFKAMQSQTGMVNVVN